MGWHFDRARYPRGAEPRRLLPFGDQTGECRVGWRCGPAQLRRCPASITPRTYSPASTSSVGGSSRSSSPEGGVVDAHGSRPLQACPQLQQPAADPTLHGPEWGAAADSQLFVRRAVEKRGTDECAAPRVELVEGSGRGACGRRSRSASSSGAACGSVNSGDKVDRGRVRLPSGGCVGGLSPDCERSCSATPGRSPGWRRIAPPSAKWLANTSCKTSSASARAGSTRRQMPKSFAEVRR